MGSYSASLSSSVPASASCSFPYLFCRLCLPLCDPFLLAVDVRVNSHLRREILSPLRPVMSNQTSGFSDTPRYRFGPRGVQVASALNAILPAMNEAPDRPGWGRGWVAAAVALPFMYLLSSGPMQTVAFRRHVSYITDSRGRVVAGARIDPGRWWPKVYAPLWRAADESWGRPLEWYWDLFPIRKAVEKPEQ